MEKPALKIILIDDNAAHRTLIKRAIKRGRSETDIIEAGSLTEGRQLLFSSNPNKDAPSLAVVDLNLGDGRGSTLISEIRSQTELSELPVIVLSTSSLEEDIRECYREGANCYLTKSKDVHTFSKDIASAVSYLLLFGDNSKSRPETFD